jgi:tripartite ATP-independent transporter DctP family solute receptor
MKIYAITSLLTVFSLVLFLSLDKGGYTWQETTPIDDEQTGLNELIVIRFSHVVAENTPKGLAAQKFAELVSKKTSGRIKVEVYPNGILYSDGDELDAITSGEIQMIAPSYSKMTDLVPEWKVLDLPFLFKDNNHVKGFIEGETDEELLDKLNHPSLKGLAFWTNGFKQMTSNLKPLKTPDDFSGQTFRVMPGKVIKNQFELLGADTVITSFDQVYSSLEKKDVNGQENTISNIYSRKLYKVQNYLTLSNHGYLGYAVIMNEDFWDSLNPSFQQSILVAMKETTAWILEESMKMNKSQLVDIQKHSSIELYELEGKHKTVWIKHFQPLYKEVEDEVGAEFIQRITSSYKHE